MNGNHATALQRRVVWLIAIFSLMLYALPWAQAEETDDDLLLLARINAAFAKLVNRALPSIVQIDTTKTLAEDPHRGIPGFPFRFRAPEQREATSLGSGVIVSRDGYILTNNHVIEGAEEIQVTLADKRHFDARLVGTDKYTEIALVKIDAQDLPALPLGDSDALQVGEWVIAIGSPFRLEQTVTRGVVSAKGRSRLYIIEDQGYEDFIQTDAAINPGNSGGALINIRGELIGINTAILTGGLSRSNAGVGFAVPINMASHVMDSLIRHGRVVRGWLGVGIQSVTEHTANELGLEQTTGALVTEVFTSGPAEKAGVKVRDVIVNFNGHSVTDSEELRKIVADTAINGAVEMHVIREGENKVLQVEVGERTEDVLAQANRGGADWRNSFRFNSGPLAGVEVGNLTADVAEQLGYQGEEGVIVTRVEPDSQAAQAGIETGDLIQEVEMENVKDVATLSRVVRRVAEAKRLILYVRSHAGGGKYIKLRENEEATE